MRAAIYCRVSTDDQAKDGKTSLDDQERRLREWVARQPDWEVAGVWRDDETATGTTERPDWAKLMLAAGRREFGAVVVTTMSRFTRDEAEYLRWLRELSVYGVALWLADAGQVDINDDWSAFFGGINATFAAQMRRVQLRQLANGAHATVRDGRFPTGSQGAPFGLMVADGRLVEHPAEAATVRLAVQLVLDEGRSLRETCDLLNGMGWLSRGQPGKGPVAWSVPVLRRRLQNRSLVGELRWGDGPDATRNPDETLKYGGGVDVAAPAVVPPERFQALQARLVVHGPARDHGTSYPLTGGVFASDCGRYYTGIYKNDREGRLYRCRGKNVVVRGPGEPRCDCRWFPADWAEEATWEQVCTRLSDPDRLRGFVTRHLALGTDHTPDDLERLRAEETAGRAQLKATVAAMVRKGADPDFVATVFAERTAELDAMARRVADIARVRADAKARQAALDQVDRWAAAAAGLERLGRQQRDEAMKLVVRRVEPGDGKRPELRVTVTRPDRLWNQDGQDPSGTDGVFPEEMLLAA